MLLKSWKNILQEHRNKIKKSDSGEIITGKRNLLGKTILISFKNCTVTHNKTFLFNPEWGIYDMAVGKDVVSAFSGPADLNSFDLITHITTSNTIHFEKTKERQEIEVLYQQIRDYRENKNRTISRTKVLEQLIKQHPNDWLLPVDLYELAHLESETELCEKILNHLEFIKQNNPEFGLLIDNGLEIVKNEKAIN